MNITVQTPVADQTAHAAPPSLAKGLIVQGRVIGALLMREIHTRYGRDNIGYLWMIAEPMMLGTAVGLMHIGQKARDTDFNPVTIATIGYTLFIMFRSMVNRSEGALEGNLPLLYHRMVSVTDIVIARALLEGAGTFLSFTILFLILISVGYASFPERPLMLMLGITYIFWISLGVSMLVVGGTYEHKVLGRLVHPFTYFMLPMSAAFFRVQWVPQPWRGYMLWNPLPQMFEIIRYGEFHTATLEYVNFLYLTAFCLVLTLLGLIACRSVRQRIHLS